MFVPETFPIALLMMVTSMICWGSWANTYKLTKGYRFELFYWDYAIGILASKEPHTRKYDLPGFYASGTMGCYGLLRRFERK